MLGRRAERQAYPKVGSDEACRYVRASAITTRASRQEFYPGNHQLSSRGRKTPVFLGGSVRSYNSGSRNVTREPVPFSHPFIQAREVARSHYWIYAANQMPTCFSARSPITANLNI